jgi:acyl carrier protein
MSNQILNDIVEIIKPYVKNEAAKTNILPDAHFIKDLNINSARLVDIVLALEDKFDIAINDEEAETITNLNEAVNLISKKQGA